MKKDFLNIIIEIKSGNETPLIELYNKYRDEFILWSKKNLGTHDEQAKDAFQEAILDFNKNIVSEKLTEATSSVKTYLFQIGKHKALNILKKENRLTYHNDLQVIKGKEFEDFMDNENEVYTKELINKALIQLPQNCQNLLKLFYFNEYDMDSIARELNYKNSDTAKSKKSNCMKKLIKELNNLSKMLVL